AQLGALEPLLADCGKHDRLRAEIMRLTAQREALRYYFAAIKAELVTAELDEISAERSRLTVLRDDLGRGVAELRETETALRVELAGHGGNRLAEEDRQVAEGEKTGAVRLAKAGLFAALLTAADRDPVAGSEQFIERRRQILAAREAARETLASQ